MNQYEGMIIFPEALNEEALEAAVGSVKSEMERLGAQVASVTRLGKRTFARLMDKQKAGHYVVYGFAMDGSQLKPLHERFKLMPEVFRAQIICAKPVSAPAEQATPETSEEEKDDGIS